MPDAAPEPPRLPEIAPPANNPLDFSQTPSCTENDAIELSATAMRRRFSLPSLARPVWGIFIILLSAVLLSSVYGAWYVYQYKYHIPRLAEMSYFLTSYYKHERDIESNRMSIAISRMGMFDVEHDKEEDILRIISYMKTHNRVVDNSLSASDNASKIKYHSDIRHNRFGHNDDDNELAPGRPAGKDAVEAACNFWQHKLKQIRDKARNMEEDERLREKGERLRKKKANEEAMHEFGMDLREMDRYLGREIRNMSVSEHRAFELEVKKLSR